LVPIHSLEQLSNLKPNFDKIKKWSITNQVNGLYVYTKETYNSGLDFHARGFNPMTGLNEDAATGVAAAALSIVMRKSLTIEQGYFIGAPCVIDVLYVSNCRALVGGKARINQDDIFITK